MRPMSLLALCYPELSADDRRFVGEFRDRYDLAYRDVVRPHFTMVFQVQDLAESTFSEHVARAAKRAAAIRFACRYAMVHSDPRSDDCQLFLVPDEGFSELALLHDALYTGVLASKLTLEIPYVPHIGIATLEDPARCKQLADELNGRGLNIGGMIDAISVVDYDGRLVTDLRHFPLGNHARETR